MMTPMRVLAALLLLSGSGCGSQASDTASRVDPPRQDTAGRAAADEQRDIVQITCDGLETSILAAEPTRSGFLRSFGAPDTVIATTEPNRHVGGAIDSLFSVRYPGLEAEFRTPTGARDLISSARISDARYVRFREVAPGAPASQVIAALGEPTRQTESELVYECGVVEQPVTFVLRNGAVDRIEIEYYVD